MKVAALQMLWVNCVERLKDRVNNRSFWEALEKAHPITVESNILIIGLDPQNFNWASHLQQVSNMHAITEVVRELFNQPLQVRIIEGTTLQDWEAAKEKDARVAVMKQSATTRSITEDRQLVGWDGLYEQVARLYMQTPLRSSRKARRAMPTRRFTCWQKRWTRCMASIPMKRRNAVCRAHWSGSATRRIFLPPCWLLNWNVCAPGAKPVCPPSPQWILTPPDLILFAI